MVNYLGAFYEIGLNSWQLYKEFPLLKQRYSDYAEKKGGEETTRFFLHSTLAACRVLCITLNTTKIILLYNKNDLDSEQKEKLKQFLNKIQKSNSVAKMALLTNTCLIDVASKKGRDFFGNSNNWFIASNLFNQFLLDQKLINDACFQNIDLASGAIQGGLNICSFITNQDSIEKIHEFFLFQYDRYISPFNLENLKLKKADLCKCDIRNINYEEIPLKHKKNYIFRRFKDFFTKKCIRYPVIVTDDDQNPIRPIRLFERKVLLSYLLNHPNPIYPGTNMEIALCQVKEHLVIRRLIENEMKKLSIEL